MSETNAPNTGLKNPFDSWKSIAISLYMTLVGYGVLVGIPVINTAWVTLLGFSEPQGGRIAGMDLGWFGSWRSSYRYFDYEGQPSVSSNFGHVSCCFSQCFMHHDGGL